MVGMMLIPTGHETFCVNSIIALYEVLNLLYPIAQNLNRLDKDYSSGLNLVRSQCHCTFCITLSFCHTHVMPRLSRPYPTPFMLIHLPQALGFAEQQCPCRVRRYAVWQAEREAQTRRDGGVIVAGCVNRSVVSHE